MSDQQVAEESSQPAFKIPTIYFVYHTNDTNKQQQLQSWIHDWFQLQTVCLEIQGEQDEPNWSSKIDKDSEDLVLFLLSQSLSNWWHRQGGGKKIQDLMLTSSNLNQCAVIIEQGMEFDGFENLAKYQGFRWIDDDLKKWKSTENDPAARNDFNYRILQWLAARIGINTANKGHVFLSYSHKHSSNQKDVLQRLGQLKFLQCWVDKNDLGLGEGWQEKIKDSVEECTFFVALLTRDYLKSSWCAQELIRALKGKKNIMLLKCKENFTLENVNSNFQDFFKDGMIDVTREINHKLDTSLLSIDPQKLDTAIYTMLYESTKSLGQSGLDPLEDLGNHAETIDKENAGTEVDLLFSRESEKETANVRREEEQTFIKLIKDELITSESTYNPFIPVIGPGIAPEFYIRLDKLLQQIAYGDTNQKCDYPNSKYLEEFIGSPCQACPLLVTKRPSTPLDSTSLRDQLKKNRGDACPMVKMYYESVKLYGYDADILLLQQDALTAMGSIETIGEKLFFKDDISSDGLYNKIKDKSRQCEYFKLSESESCRLEQTKELIRRLLMTKQPQDIGNTKAHAFPVIVTTRYDNIVEDLMKEILSEQRGQNCLQDDYFDIVYFKPPPPARLLHATRRDHGSFVFRKSNAPNNKMEFEPASNQFIDFLGIRHLKRPLLVQLMGRLDDRFVITRDQCNGLLRTSEPIPTSKPDNQEEPKSTDVDPIGDLRKVFNTSGGKFFLFVGYDSNDPTLSVMLKSLWDLSNQTDNSNRFEGALVSYSEPPERIRKILEHEYKITTIGVPDMSSFLDKILALIPAAVREN
jgi:hypothetical protein